MTDTPRLEQMIRPPPAVAAAVIAACQAAVSSVVPSTTAPWPLPDNHLVLKSTLATGAGGAMIGARGPSGTFGNFTNVTLRLENVSFRMPANPSHTALDLRYVACADLDNVVVDAGNYFCEGISQPTGTGSYAIRMPGNDNGAHSRLGQVDVIGFYNGFEFAEHTVGESVSAWACRKAFTFLTTNHASKFQRLMAVHCQRGIVGSGTHYVDVDQFDVEHAASGTWVTVYDVDDASNVLHGTAWWHVVLAGAGIDATFTKNGGVNLHTNRVGTAASGGGGSSLTVQDQSGDIAVGVTQIDFQGAGVTATAGSSEVVVTIPGETPLTVQDENSNVSTAVSQIDFQGAGVTVTAGTGEVIVTIPGTTTTSTKELVMQDGVTAPPVPLETEARDDWLYQD